MRKRLLLLLVLSISSIGVITSCSSDMTDDLTSFSKHYAAEDYPSLSDVEIDISSQSVVFTSQISNLGSYTIKKSLGYGFVLSSVNEVPIIKGSGNSRYFSNDLDSDGKFTKELTTLKNDVPYYVRSYAIIQQGGTTVDTIYSEVKPFTISTMNPVIETMPVVNRAKMGACVFARFKDAGNVGHVKWGACLSQSPLPTPRNCEDLQFARDTCKLEGYLGEFGVFFENLKPRTMYHTRAFVITSAKDTIFGEDRIFRTSEGGNYAWEWGANEDGAKKAGAWARIVEAMDSASYYYNNYSNLYLRAHVEYNEGVQTADCSYGGWIRFGANSRYQWVGTAQHETAHGLGVGTCWNWKTLINYDGDRKWTGPVATRTLRAVMDDQTLRISGDAQHFWPGGINQREEVTNGTANSYGVYVKNERMLRCNAMILNGMQIDGLACP